MPQAALLVAFVDAALGVDGPALCEARSALLDALGPAALVDAAAIVASFNAVVKIADGTGIPLEPEKAAATESLRQGLGIEGMRKP